MSLLNVAQIIASIVLVLIILSQVREAGSGMFGSAQNTVRTRRGLERTMFQFTIVLIVVFPGSLGTERPLLRLIAPWPA